MTILAALRSRGAVVIGADSEERSAAGRRRTTKIVSPQPGLILAWAGYKDVAQAMVLSLQEDPLELRGPRSEVARAAKDRFRRVRDDPDVEHRSDANEFILGWFCEAEQKPVGLRLPSQGSALWVEQWEYAGSRAAVSTARIVEASIGYILIENLGAEQLSLVALKVLRGSIEAAPASAGVGGEIQLATITAAEVRVLGSSEVRAVNDALDVWEERCAELLPGAGRGATRSRRRDHGLGPPV